MRSIFAYADFRAFLRDFYRYRKRLGAYSYRMFSERAGITAPNLLKLVIDGKKRLTVENIHRFARACELRFHEREYFEALVHLGQAIREEERKYHRWRLSGMARSHRAHEKSPELQEVLTEWYFPAVMVSVAGHPVGESTAELARRCGIGAARFGACLEALRERGLVTEANGRYALKYEFANVEDPKSRSMRQRTYLKRQLALSAEAFERAYEKQAKFLSHTFTLSKRELESVYDRMHALLDELDERSAGDSGRDVVQLNMQLFTLDQLNA